MNNLIGKFVRIKWLSPNEKFKVVFVEEGSGHKYNMLIEIDPIINRKSLGYIGWRANDTEHNKQIGHEYWWVNSDEIIVKKLLTNE